MAANSQLRERVIDACMADGLQPFLPSRSMCTDNAAMVAATGWYRLHSDGPSPLDVGAQPNLRLESRRPEGRGRPARQAGSYGSTGRVAPWGAGAYR